MNRITSREFNQDASGAKRRTAQGPVFITDRGRLAHVLLSIDDYRRLTGKPSSVLESLVQRKGGTFDADFPRAKDVLKSIDLD